MSAERQYITVVCPDCQKTRQLVRSGEMKTRRCNSCAKKGNRVTHGMSETRTYRIWCSMYTRCNYQKNVSYKNYGGRGITICERWRSFENFFADMGHPPSDKHSIDRVNNDGNYEPSNCRWATPNEQAGNSRNAIRLTFGGLTFSISEWSRRTGLKRATINARIEKGWSAERALTTPARGQR
jgi:hypothetical protein